MNGSIIIGKLKKTTARIVYLKTAFLVQIYKRGGNEVDAG